MLEKQGEKGNNNIGEKRGRLSLEYMKEGKQEWMRQNLHGLARRKHDCWGNRDT